MLGKYTIFAQVCRLHEQPLRATAQPAVRNHPQQEQQQRNVYSDSLGPEHSPVALWQAAA